MDEKKKAVRGRILVVDDDSAARTGLQKLLSLERFEVETAEDGVAAHKLIQEHTPDVVVTDLQMPRMDGLELLKKLRADGVDVPVILVTALGEVGAAVSAMRAGADDYLQKPIDVDALLLSIDRVLERRALKDEAENLRRHVRQVDGTGLQGLIGTSPAMQSVYRVAKQVAKSRATVLITGESGTGKGELARAIHTLSGRAKAPFVSLHCAALTETLLESELFGHEKGSFTGADRRRVGRIEQAQGGTLFLDEIGEISPVVQTKLLRVLQERVIERVGGNESIEVDVRFVAATNKDLTKEVNEGRFREDLFYRLNVVHVDMPPLRIRGSDVLLLAEHFRQKFAADNHVQIEAFTDAARAKIAAHRWPGNVRALENAIERAVVLCEGNQIGSDDLPFDAVPEGLGGIRIPGSTMAEIERHAIVKTLESVQGSTAKASEILDVSVRTIQYRMHDYGLK